MHDVRGTSALVDYFSLALTHGLMAIALWRLLARSELDVEHAAEAPRPWSRRKAPARDSEPHGDTEGMRDA